MINPRDIHNLDQAMAETNGHIVPAIASMYKKFVEEGVPPAQAVLLTSALLTTIMNTPRPPK